MATKQVKQHLNFLTRKPTMETSGNRRQEGIWESNTIKKTFF